MNPERMQYGPPEAIRLRVLLEDTEPILTVEMLEPGTLVRVVRGVFAGFMGFIREDPFAEEVPFTLILEEAT